MRFPGSVGCGGLENEVSRFRWLWGAGKGGFQVLLAVGGSESEVPRFCWPLGAGKMRFQGYSLYTSSS